MPLGDVTVAATLAGVAILLTLLLAWSIHRRRAGRPTARLRRVCCDMLNNVVIPDGEDGQIQLEYALLCPRGVVVIDLKRLSGKLFASDSMREWAMISASQRSAISNPQGALYDRIAAVKRLLPDVPVEGFIGLTGPGELSKGSPSHVITLDALIAELQAELRSADQPREEIRSAWEHLRQSSIKL